ncbi:MAG: aminopeptidase P family protein [Planctomycetes bacterium]|nr:aminopeptidase P family protein [Planctomycetota bacterium]
MRRLLTVLVVAALSPICWMQDAPIAERTTRTSSRPFPFQHRFHLPQAEELKARREALAARIGTGVVLLLSPERPSDVGLMRYRPDSNVYYFTGVETDPVALVLVAKDGRIIDEKLFAPPDSQSFALWNGRRTTAGPEAAAAAGMSETQVVSLTAPRGRPGTGFVPVEEAIAAGLKTSGGPLYLDNISRGSRPKAGTFDPRATTREESVREFFIEKQKDLKVQALGSAAGTVRSIKSNYELEMLQAAVDATGDAVNVMMANARPGLYEFEFMGMALGAFFENGSSGTAYAPICASGPNACVLHYDENRRRTEQGELILCDVGTEFGRYAADITRTFPVSGRFSDEQKHVYSTVLAAQAAAAAILKPGVTLNDLHNAAIKVIREAGFDPLRVLPHGVSHHIGLDVHDPGDMRMVPGMVITIEPGIYMRKEGFGVRIEDMYLVTEKGNRCLSAAIPKSVEAVEALCGRDTR